MLLEKKPYRYHFRDNISEYANIWKSKIMSHLFHDVSQSNYYLCINRVIFVPALLLTFRDTYIILSSILAHRFLIIYYFINEKDWNEHEGNKATKTH